MSKIKNELVLSLMRERIKREIIDWMMPDYVSIKDMNNLVDKIMIHIESAAKQID